jgi:toxin ParE1/3/4
MRLEWIGSSLSDMASIHDYIGARNPAAAERISDIIHKAALRLKAFPHLGRPTHWPDVRELQVPGLPYLLPYRVHDDIIEILAVFDERMERPEEWI